MGLFDSVTSVFDDAKAAAGRFADNVVLGFAGAEDTVLKASGADPNAHHAADVYAAQTPNTEVGPLQIAEANGSILEKAAENTVQDATDIATLGGSKLVRAAAEGTVNTVVAAAHQIYEALPSGWSVAIIAGGVLVALGGGGYLAWRVLK